METHHAPVIEFTRAGSYFVNSRELICLGIEAVNALLARLKNPELAPQFLNIEPSLVERHSVKELG